MPFILIIRSVLTFSGCHSSQVTYICSVHKLKEIFLFHSTVTFKIRISQEHLRLQQFMGILFLVTKLFFFFLLAKGKTNIVLVLWLVEIKILKKI